MNSIEPHEFQKRHWLRPDECRVCLIGRALHHGAMRHGHWVESRPLDASWERRAIWTAALKHPIAAWNRVKRWRRLPIPFSLK